MAQFAQTKSLTVGGRTFIGSEVDNLIVLHGLVASTSTWSTLRLANGTGGYLTTGTLKIIAYKLQQSEASSTGYFQLLYGDTAVLNTVAPTNPIYMTGAVNIWSSGVATGGGSGTAYSVNPVEGMLNFDVPTSKYPAIVCPGGVARVTFFCLY
ncbi:MAG: hypothetical protein H0X02_05845 [Nitrosomonas sp.]|nr:hypothetical protein [Nitrosomonas sp.]